MRWSFVEKRAHHKASWRRRWLVLAPTALGYYADALDMTPQVRERARPCGGGGSLL